MVLGRLTVQGERKTSQYRGIWDCTRQIIKQARHTFASTCLCFGGGGGGGGGAVDRMLCRRCRSTGEPPYLPGRAMSAGGLSCVTSMQPEGVL